jgi:phage gp36-like protein
MLRGWRPHQSRHRRNFNTDMSYCTQSDIEGEIQNADLIMLTDDTNTGLVNSTVLNAVIQNASDFIDSHLAGIYTVPFSNPIPTAVKSWCVTVSCYRLYRRRLNPMEKNNYAEAYREVCSQLNDIRKGETGVDLGVPRTVTQGAVAGQQTIYGGVYGAPLSSSM